MKSDVIKVWAATLCFGSVVAFGFLAPVIFPERNPFDAWALLTIIGTLICMINVFVLFPHELTEIIDDPKAYIAGIVGCICFLIALNAGYSAHGIQLSSARFSPAVSTLIIAGSSLIWFWFLRNVYISNVMPMNENRFMRRTRLLWFILPIGFVITPATYMLI